MLTLCVLAADNKRCWLVDKPLVLLSTGVEGGIAPRPAPFQLIILPEGNATRLYVLHRQQDGVKATYTQGKGPAFATVQKELAGLYQLPQEEQSGMADPYGQAVALHSHDGQHCWVNQPPTGCVRGAQTVHPTPEQKASFIGYTKQLEKLGESAREPLSEKEYQEVFASLIPARQ